MKPYIRLFLTVAIMNIVAFSGAHANDQTVIDAVRQQIYRYWNAPYVKTPVSKVTVHVKYDPDGNLQYLKLAPEDAKKYEQDPDFRKTADSVLRAVEKASPLNNLPEGSYAVWKEMELSFAPHDMLL